MVNRVALSGSDPLPGTNVTKLEVEQAKQEFEARAYDSLNNFESNVMVDLCRCLMTLSPLNLIVCLREWKISLATEEARAWDEVSRS